MIVLDSPSFNAAISVYILIRYILLIFFVDFIIKSLQYITLQNYKIDLNLYIHR